MKKRIKAISVIIAVLMLLCAFTVSTFATGEVENPGSDIVTPDPPVTPDPVTPTDAPITPDPVTPTDPVTPDPGITEDPTDYVDDGNDNQQSGGYVDNSDDEFYYYDEDQMANSIENSAGSVQEVTDLYDTSDMDVSALKETKWDNITLDTNTSKTDAMDFSAIKDNTNSDDDGTWIIYTGFVLIGLAVIGILYFIIATATYKKKLKNLKKRQQAHDSNRSRSDYGDYSDYPTQSDYNRRYSNKKRYASDGMGYAERKRLKADTAEINLPSKYRARH